jgi:hypothetical protein
VLLSEWGATGSDDKRESRHFQTVFVDPLVVEPGCVEEEHGLLSPSACISRGECRGIVWVREKRLSDREACLSQIRKVDLVKASHIPASRYPNVY